MANSRRTVVLLLVALSMIASSCSSASSPGAAPSDETERAVEACVVDQLMALLQSGLPTYDYDPAGSYGEVDAKAQVAVWGRITSAQRASVNGASFTELSVVDVVELDGTQHPAITVVAFDSVWAERDRSDPLAVSVELADAHFFGFLSPWSGRRGGWSPGIEGLYISCGYTAPLYAVIEDGRGPGDPVNPSIEELGEVITAQRELRETTAGG